MALARTYKIGILIGITALVLTAGGAIAYASIPRAERHDRRLLQDVRPGAGRADHHRLHGHVPVRDRGAELEPDRTAGTGGSVHCGTGRLGSGGLYGRRVSVRVRKQPGSVPV